METERLYQLDSYLKTFTAKIIGHDQAQNGVLLDRSAFYPSGGGQSADSGVIHVDGQAYRVTTIGKGYVHVLDGALPPVGADVTGVLDWENRYRLMRTHTAMHVLCGVVWRDYNSLVTGSTMESLKGRMDFEFDRLQKDLVQEIEAAINAEVTAARPVKLNLITRDEAAQIPDLIRTKANLIPDYVKLIRTVELVGLDLQACGGTHLANTSEIGPIRITEYKSKGGINKRIYFELEA